MKKFLALAFASILAALCIGLPITARGLAPASTAATTSTVLLTTDVNWEQLNPARGDQSPQAGTLWGDRTGPGPDGFLLQPVDGFRSPPHIHNVAYRGVVIDGTLHNDDPTAEDMFMPVGSFWTQPAGGVHITAALGDDALAYIEVEDYFGVQPADQAFASDEQPVNVDASNIVWLDASNTSWIESSGLANDAEGPEIAFLWGNFQGTPSDSPLNGTLVKLPAGFSGVIRNEGSEIRAVVIQGQPQHQILGKGTAKTAVKNAINTLEPGSYFSSMGPSMHQISSAADTESVFYVRTDGRFQVTPASASLR